MYLHHILLLSIQEHSGIEDLVSKWLHFGRVDYKQLHIHAGRDDDYITNRN